MPKVSTWSVIAISDAESGVKLRRNGEHIGKDLVASRKTLQLVRGKRFAGEGGGEVRIQNPLSLEPRFLTDDSIKRKKRMATKIGDFDIVFGDPRQPKALPLDHPKARFTEWGTETFVLKKGTVRRSGALPLPCDILFERDVPLHVRLSNSSVWNDY